jgi:hypothetical protein
LQTFPSARQMVRDHGLIAQDRKESIQDNPAVGA